jgi:CO/xanthine dehydrogenase Mo-binding subunit
MSAAVGKNLERVDGYGKVTGKAAYTGDLNIPGMIHGKVLRSAHAHARVVKIDGSKAEQVPGVLAVLTRENCQVATPYIGAMIKDQCLVAFDKVRYVGDIVAAVAATDESIAEKALAVIEIEYEELPVVTTVEEALAEKAPLIHEPVRRARPPQYGRGASYILHEQSNICHHFRYQRGDIEDGFKAADVIYEDTFYFPSAHHYPMESNVSVANFDKDGVTIWASTQGPFGLRQEVARVFGMPLSDIRVLVPYVGGGYGGAKGLVPSIIGVALSRLARRPVRVNFSAEENFMTICQPRAKITMKTGLKKDGTFIARRCELFLNAGAYVNSTPSVAEKAGYRGHGPYRFPYVLTDAYAIYTNTVPTGSFRGFGGPQVAFSYESHVDMIAQRMKLDPLDLRRKNLLTKGEDFAAGDTPTDCDLKGALAQVADAIGWGTEDKAHTPSGIKRGKGLACALKDGGGTKKAAHANVKILNDGSIVVVSGSVEIGQGVQTVMQQIVAEEFSISADRVRVDEIDTRYTPFDTATNASSATALMGSAVLSAAIDARTQLLHSTASRLDAPHGEVKFANGAILCREQRLEIGEAMRLCFGESGGEIIGRGFFQLPSDANVPLGSPTPFWEIGFGAAEVEVDENTGAVKVIQYISLTDAGKIIHPVQCRGQDEGAAIFGLGQALFEDMVYENGRLMNPNLVDYRLPRFRDLPALFKTIILEQGGGCGPYGAKGMGEGGILAVAPAICNAVYNATGVRITQVPIKTEKLLQALQTRSDSPEQR